jgi:manganese oxidase
MNAMGHNVRNFIGVSMRDLSKAIGKLVPDYHAMGSAGMADMGSMEHPMPDNTLPMMTGFGQFGPIEMGGMFTMMKIREGLEVGDYSDPGPYKHPPGTVAYEVNRTANEPPRPPENSSTRRPAAVRPGSKTTPKAHH